MNFKKIFFFILLFLMTLFSVILNSRNKIGLLCDNLELKNYLIKTLSKYFIISPSLKDSDILICGSEKNIKKCLKYNKKIVAINFISYNLNRIKNDKIIAYFPVNFRIKDVYKFINYNIDLKNKCLLTHFDIKDINTNDLIIFKVKKIGEVPLVLNEALKKCDLIIGIPDDIVFNYFSTRFIIKRIILNGKVFTGFSKRMSDLGAIYSFEINIEKYVRKITRFIKKYFNKKIENDKKVFYPEFSEFDVIENSNLIKTYQNEVKK